MRILYGIKANGPLNSKIHGNVYARVNSGLVHFLIREQEAKSALMATQIGQKMSVYQRVERLMPHEMTSRLFDEMAKRLAPNFEKSFAKPIQCGKLLKLTFPFLWDAKVETKSEMTHGASLNVE